MNRQPSLDRNFDEQLQTLAVALRQSTIGYYRSAVNRFLRYLHTAYPKLRTVSQLRRDPHILGWLRSLGQETPPWSNRSRRACLMCVRRLLDDLISNGQPLAEGLILRQDFPPPDLYLPKPLSPENDRLLDHQLCQADDLHSNALRLLRATGMRIGECLRLQTDGLRHLSRSRSGKLTVRPRSVEVGCSGRIYTPLGSWTDSLTWCVAPNRGRGTD